MFDKFSQKQRNYTKINFVNALEEVTPNIYIDEDINISGTGTNPVSQIINSHLYTLSNIPNILPVSSLSSDNQFSAIGTAAGISQYFVKQNGLTRVDTLDFENDVLTLLGKSLSDFQTSAEFSSYLETFLPTIQLNSPTETAFGTDASARHEYLISNLSWLYFLNTTGTAGCTYAPSSSVKDLLVTNTFTGKRINLNDCLKAFSEYIFHNYENQSSWQSMGIIPTNYLPSGYLTPSSQYTSGTQQLDKLKTMIDVVYSPAIVDQGDTTVHDAIYNYLTLDTVLEDTTSQGPFYNLLRAFSYAMMDVEEDVEKLSVLYDLEQCPDELLPEIAKLIGWRLYGHESNSWRIQLFNAVDIYKRAGTKQSIQIAINTIFSREEFDVSSNIHELWESYIPHLIYYSLATDSSSFSDFSTWTPEKAFSMGVEEYSFSSMDENIRLSVDRILYVLHKYFPDVFIMGNKEFPTDEEWFRFNYRGRTTYLPPWEEIPYYSNCQVTEKFLSKLEDQLACFGVRQGFALEVVNYIRDNTMRAYDDIREGNSWLMFTSGVNYPSNWTQTLNDISTNRAEFLSLWSGKSSHYKLILESDTFNFAKNTVRSDSKGSIGIIGRAANDFAPAHAIGDIRLQAGTTDDYTTNSSRLNYLDLGKEDSFTTTNGSVSSLFNNRAIYGMNMPSGTMFERGDVDHLSDVSSYNSLGLSYPRNAFRRRDLKNILPMDGFYDRTGFNGPISWQASTVEYSLNSLSSLGFLPLGYIPSAGAFLAINDYNNVPEVYNSCQTVGIGNLFSGVYVSSCFPCRGLSAVGSDAKHTQYSVSSDRYVDRGQLDPIVATIHSIEEKRKAFIGVSSVSSLYADYVGTFGWKENSQSWANSSTELNEAFPNSHQDYTNFKFSRGIHQLYKDYTKHFNRHHTRPSILDSHGPNILAHAFGSVFNNSNFDEYGNAVNHFPNIIASSTDSALPLNNREKLFNLADTNLNLYGTTLHRAQVPNPNLLAYTVDIGLDPNITFNSDRNGTWALWGDIGTFSSVEHANPFGGVSSMILSGEGDATGKVAAIFQHQRYANEPNLRLPEFDSDSSISFSMYVKEYDNASKACSSFTINALDWTPTNFSYLVSYEFDGGVPTVKSEGFGTTSKVEKVGDDGWYRVSTTVAGNPNSVTHDGDEMTALIYLSDHTADDTGINVANKLIYWYAPQVEQHPTKDRWTLPSPYQAVKGLTPGPDEMFTTEDPSSIVVPTQFVGRDAIAELRNDTVISGVDLVQTSGGSVNNSFTFYNIDKSHAKTDHPNFAIDNPLLKLTSVNGFPRIRYSTKGADIPIESGLSVSKNLLIKDHDFRFDVKYSGGTPDGKEVGGVGMGVWIHTGEEDGYIWSLNNKGDWEYVDVTSIDTKVLYDNYVYTNTMDSRNRIFEKPKNDPYIQCLDSIGIENEKNVIMSFLEEDFKTFSVNFSTRNQPISVPERYYKNYQQVHREDQDYIIEVFMINNYRSPYKFALLDNVNLIDVTQNLRTMIPVYGDSTGLPKDIDPLCNIKRIELTKEEVLNIIKYFNKLSGATFRRSSAGRVAADTSGFLEASGGSRINYRQSYEWPNNYVTTEGDSAADENVSSNERLIIDL